MAEIKIQWESGNELYCFAHTLPITITFVCLNDNNNPCRTKLYALMQHVENVHFHVSDLGIIGLWQVGHYHYKLTVAPSQGSTGKLKFS